MSSVQHNTAVIEKLGDVFRNLGAGWVMWLLIGLSVISVAVMIERAIYFGRRSFGDVDALMRMLATGDLAAAVKLVADRRGLEVEVVRQGIAAAPRGAEAVEEMVQATIGRERLRYERFLSYLGTLGNNAPFIGLFGTVLGIVEAFAALASNAKTGAVTEGAANIMTGVSEALVATAVGLLVALPAVAMFNVFGRWLKTIIARSESLGHALASHLKSVTPADAPRTET
ncbi:MAG TPA: MotA/TolQ/ExbB proton channel family protein [Polyangia bacterium]|jgi:biopolymer transport protein ExbB|nr:MotA/TolQ/ExbB proton channel family protein [Polyangia bacterium]